MTPRLTSAFLATSVHGLVLLLLLAAWRAPQAGVQGAAGQRVTTISVAGAQIEAEKAESRKKPEPRSKASPAEAANSKVPSVSPPPERPIVSEVALPKPLVIAHGDGNQGAGPAEPSAAQPPVPAPATLREPAAASGSGRPGAASAASESSAPAGAIEGRNAYAVKVFRHILKRKAFPARLARAGIRGRVLVRFNLTGSGGITDIAIARSSGVVALDGLALEQVRDAVPYPLPPKELSAAQLHFIVPMTYRPST
ncbi:TonB family protein [Novosphingobium sp.]|uniref:energy transducer TonB family protein n=1 Tax=Novosphingobium sp. TaxID=1874826 RepID=UPI0028A997FC|nr:TonB family protein [Novosphingobium sp.]